MHWISFISVRSYWLWSVYCVILSSWQTFAIARKMWKNNRNGVGIGFFFSPLLSTHTVENSAAETGCTTNRQLVSGLRWKIHSFITGPVVWMWPGGDQSFIMGPTGAKMAAFSDAVEWRGGKRVKAAAGNELYVRETERSSHIKFMCSYWHKCSTVHPLRLVLQHLCVCQRVKDLAICFDFSAEGHGHNTI